MSGPTEAWSRSEDPRDSTVDLPRADAASAVLPPEHGQQQATTPSPGRSASTRSNRPVIAAQGSATGPGPASGTPPDGFEAASAPGRPAGSAVPNGPARPRERTEPDGRFGSARPRAGSLADLRSRLARLPYGHPSSPYDDGGAAKLPPPRLRQLELGLPAPEREPANGTPQPREPALPTAIDMLAEFRNGHDPELARNAGRRAADQDLPMQDQDRPMQDLHVPIPDLDVPIPDLDTPNDDLDAPLQDRRRPVQDPDVQVDDLDVPTDDLAAPSPDSDALSPDLDGPVPDAGAPRTGLAGHLQGLGASMPGGSLPDGPLPDAVEPAQDLAPLPDMDTQIPDFGAPAPDLAPLPDLDVQSADLGAQVPDLAPLPDPLDGHHGVPDWPGSNGSARRPDDSLTSRYSAPLVTPDSRPGQNGNGRRHTRNELQDPYALPPSADLPQTRRTVNGDPSRQPPRDRRTAPQQAVSPPLLSPEHEELVRRVLAACRMAEGRNMFGSYGNSGITPAVGRVAQQLPHGGLAPDSEADSLKSADRFAAKLARLIARFPGTSAEQLAAGICDAIRYAFVFEPAEYTEGTLLVHRKLKVQGFELEARRNRWDSPEYKGIWTCWRDPAHDQPFEVQFHTTASWDAVRRTHESYMRITDPTTTPAERARLRARQVAATAAATAPPRCGQVADFRLEPR